MYIFLLSPLQAHNNDLRSPTEDLSKTCARTYSSFEKGQGILRVCLGYLGRCPKLAHYTVSICITMIIPLKKRNAKLVPGGIIHSCRGVNRDFALQASVFLAPTAASTANLLPYLDLLVISGENSTQ
jgi:hypothetical protein